MPKPPRNLLPAALLAAALAGLLPPAAHATLGGDAASVAADRGALGGSPGAAQAGAGYTVQSFTLPSGTTVREFVSAAGNVFGVAWEGPLLPDLRQLLGAEHFAAMDEGARARNREGRRGPGELRPAANPRLVIESTGHMRAFAGRAYLTDQLPTGVNTDAIR